MTPEEELTRKLESIFMPFASNRRDAVIQRNGRFVHYTSAASGLSIIKSRTFWLRSTTCMADYMEVQHGCGILHRFFADQDNRSAYNQALDACADGLALETLKLFDAWQRDIQFQSYIASISEHDESEDIHGRLSMWRAFSRASTARVAIVLKIPLVGDVAQSLNLLFSPVGYVSDQQVNAELRTVIQNIAANRDFLRTVERTRVLGTAFFMLALAALCLKHEGFHEEREWRIIYSPKRNPSPVILASSEVVDGVPQTVYKIPLTGGPPAGLKEIDVPHLLDRVIIGPTPYGWAMYEAFVNALTEAGVQDANKKVFVSGIPIRS